MYTHIGGLYSYYALMYFTFKVEEFGVDLEHSILLCARQFVPRS